MKNTNNNWEIRFGRIVDDKSKVICMLPKRDNNDIANLIIAAPDMLDALQAVVDAYGNRDTLLMEQCKAALSKAHVG